MGELDTSCGFTADFTQFLKNNSKHEIMKIMAFGGSIDLISTARLSVEKRSMISKS